MSSVGRPRVAFVRGEALNPFETQPLACLTDYDVTAVGRHQPLYEVGLVPVKVVLLRSRAQRLAPFSSHLPRRLQRHDPDELLGLQAALAGADVVHAAETFIPWTAQVASMTSDTGAKLVTTCWETIPFLYDDDERLARRKEQVKREVDMFLCTTELARQALLEEGVESDRLALVRPGVDTDRFSPQLPQERLSKMRVLLPGRAIREKGGLNLLRACARLPKDLRESLVLRVAGKGPEVRRFLVAAAALSVGHMLELPGSNSHAAMPKEYAGADVVAVPSLTTPYWEEQFGMVLVEAMACGRAILTTRSGAIPEVVGDCAVVVEPYSVEALTEALSVLLQDEGARQELGRRARLRALEHFTLRHSARGLASAYATVLQ